MEWTNKKPDYWYDQINLKISGSIQSTNTHQNVQWTIWWSIWTLRWPRIMKKKRKIQPILDRKFDWETVLLAPHSPSQSPYPYLRQLFFESLICWIFWVLCFFSFDRVVSLWPCGLAMWFLFGSQVYCIFSEIFFFSFVIDSYYSFRAYE